MNGSIQPTVELATTNGNNGVAYPYPVYPMMGSGFGGNGGFLGGDGIWALLLFALLFGNGGWGNNGGFFGGNSFDNGYAWLSNGQKEIMQNTNNGFDTLHLSNQLDTVNSGIYSLSNQLCNCCADMNSTVSNGFYNAEISANNRQMANMNTAFDLSRQFADCCCENRLGIANLGSDIAREACATRTNDTQNTQSILNAITGGIQSIKDEIFRDRIDEKDSKIADLNRQLSMKDLQASQVAQNAFIAQGLNNEVDALYNRLATCPINTVPVYGNQRIFSCPANYNGCGCGFNTTSQFI
jgi:hypothetical protein